MGSVRTVYLLCTHAEPLVNAKRLANLTLKLTDIIVAVGLPSMYILALLVVGAISNQKICNISIF